MKIVTVIGTRPQFIKASSLSREISNYDHINEVIIHTGQHFDKNMSNIFFNEMEIPIPKYNLSNILFCPTNSAIENLANEGFFNKNIKIVNCGDIMYESTLYYKTKTKNISSLSNNFILATIHRQENTDDKEKLSRIINSFNELVKLGEDIILPIHPRTRKLIEKFKLKVDFTIIEPVGYLEMIELLSKC